MDECDAIRLCLRDRDPTGFEFLVKKYRREAYVHALALLGNEADAADACQESFARAFAAVPRLARLDAFYPWFYRILRNCCLNMLSRSKTATDFSARTRQDSQRGQDWESPAFLLEKSEEQRNVWNVLSRLPPAHREILTLKYVHEMRYEDIATLLGIPRGTVMSRLYHARRAFRDAYAQASSPVRGPQPEIAS